MNRLVVMFLCCLCSVPAFAQDYLQRADSCYESGDYECAGKNYRGYQIMSGEGSRDVGDLIKNADSCMRIRILADNYFKTEDYTGAEQQYDRILKINPKDVYARKQYDVCTDKLKPVPPPMVQQQDTIEANLAVSRREPIFNADDTASYLPVNQEPEPETITAAQDSISVAKEDRQAAETKLQLTNKKTDAKATDNSNLKISGKRSGGTGLIIAGALTPVAGAGIGYLITSEKTERNGNSIVQRKYSKIIPSAIIGTAIGTGLVMWGLKVKSASKTATGYSFNPVETHDKALPSLNFQITLDGFGLTYNF